MENRWPRGRNYLGFLDETAEKHFTLVLKHMDGISYEKVIQHCRKIAIVVWQRQSMSWRGLTEKKGFEFEKQIRQTR